MRNKITYEWTLEIIEDGEIIDSQFQDILSDIPKEDLPGNDLGLVTNEGNEIDGVTGRLWAYVKDGKLPECFTNADGQPVEYKVPQRFHIELSKYINQ